jgi:hypothetical protein
MIHLLNNESFNKYFPKNACLKIVTTQEWKKIHEDCKSEQEKDELIELLYTALYKVQLSYKGKKDNFTEEFESLMETVHHG